MKKKSVMSQLFAFTNGCRGKTAFSIILAVIGVLCGMAPYFALAGILTEMIQNILTVQHIFYYVGIAILGETLVHFLLWKPIKLPITFWRISVVN